MSDREIEDYLKSVYYNAENPGALGGVEPLYQEAKKSGAHKISRARVAKFLRSQEVYTTHTQKNRAKNWSRLVSPYPGYEIDVDSAFMKWGDGKFHHYIVGVDLFSRRAAARKVADLKARTVSKALQSIVSELGAERVRFDRGSEYKNATVSSALKRKKVGYFYSYKPFKSNRAERLIKDISARLFKTMQKKGSTNWYKYLDAIVKAHNDRPSRALFGLTPNEVTPDRVAGLWKQFRREYNARLPPPTPFKHEINDFVRVTFARQPFRKAFEESNSTQYFIISARYMRGNVHRYTLKDEHNRAVNGGSYTDQQLQLVYVDEQTEFRVERIESYKRIRGVLHAKVKWWGHSSKYSTYIVASELEGLH